MDLETLSGGMAQASSEPDGEEEKDIVDHLSEATGYFHDSEAAKLRDIAEASGQKPVGLVRAAVEDEIEDREWKVAHFEDDGREYIPHNPYEYYRIHKKMQKEFEAAISELSYDDGVYGEKPEEEFETACKRLRERARVHEAKADRAEQWLEENGEDPEAVLME